MGPRQMLPDGDRGGRIMRLGFAVAGRIHRGGRLAGHHFHARQQAQLCDGRPRTVYLCLDADENGSGPRAARLWSRRLEQTGVRLLPVELPGGYDPHRFFAEGGSGAQFSRYLEQAGR
jgi:hypothetical protein